MICKVAYIKLVNVQICILVDSVDNRTNKIFMQVLKPKKWT